MKLELHIYDINDNLITSNYNLSDWRYSDDGSQLIYNIHNEIRRLGFKSGKLKHTLLFYDLIVGSTTRKQLYISEISKDRTELRIVCNVKDSTTASDFEVFKQFDKIQTIFNINRLDKKVNSINFGNNVIIDINNWIQDKVTVKTYPYSLIIKLDSPLPNNITIDTNILFLTRLYDSISYSFQLIPSNEEFNVNVLSNPNFGIKINNTTGLETSYQSWNDLLSADVSVKNLLINQFFNFYENSAKLNIDYTDYINFVFYSNAEIRLYNFKYKLKQIQILEAKSSIVGIQTFQDKYLIEIEDIKNNFDGYDYFLYYGLDTTYSWPKDVNNIPLNVNDSIAIAWYDNQILNAISFDKSNIYALSKKIPSGISDDEFNNQFMLFINMIAQHFDILWLYTSNIDMLRDRDESLTEGMSKDLIYHVLSNFGWQPQHDNQFDDLWQYILGNVTDDSGVNITIIKATTDKVAREDITKEIWKRILNNLPYIWKTKGTEEGLRSLINIYGIPRTELHIREYGGPNKLDVKSQLFVDKFNYCIKLETGNKIIVPYLSPGTIEFRFKLLSKANQTVFVREDNNISLNFIYTTNNNGRIQYSVNSGSFIYQSDEFPIYNEKWWSFMFRNEIVSGSQTFDIFVKHADYNKITFGYSGSFIVTGSNDITEIFNEDYDYFITLNGRLQEFRYWNIPLSEASFNNHTLAPSAYNGNSESSSYYNLMYRLTLGTDTNQYNHYNTLSLNSQHPSIGMLSGDCLIDGGTAASVSVDIADCNSALFTSSFEYYDGGNAYSIYCNDVVSASFVGFSNEFNYELVKEQYTYEWPDLSANRSISNKIRIENNVLESNLSISNRAEKSAFDLYPIDNSKIGVYLSTTNEVDEDIAEHMSSVNIDDFIGKINSEFRSEYPDLRRLKDYYYKQYIEMYNVKDYFQLVKYFSNSLFKHIDELTPARSNKITGLVIEPHILNRSKNILIKNKPTITNIDNNCSINITDEIYLNESNFTSLESLLDLNINSIIGGETYDLSATIDYKHDSSMYSWQNMMFDATGSAVFVNNPYWEREGVVTLLETYRKSERLKIINPLRTLPSQSYYIPAEVQDYNSIGMKNSYYKGSKLIGSAINQNSSQTPDGGPVLQSWINEDINLKSNKINQLRNYK
jgi:hypothetical protein